MPRTPTEPPGVCFVDALVTVAPQLANLDRPWLGPYRKADHELLVPGLAPPGSLALIPLRRSEQLDGVLVFSQHRPDPLHQRAGERLPRAPGAGGRHLRRERASTARA